VYSALNQKIHKIMKNFMSLGKASLCMLLLFSFSQSCTNLDEQLYDTVDVDNFFKTEEEFIAALGSAYTNFYTLGNHGNYFSLQEVGSDEVMIPTRGGDWGDGGQWVNAHRRDYKPTDPNVNGAWDFLFKGVGNCNRLIFQFETLVAQGKADPALAKKFIAELRGLRALYYYWLCDTFGNVPIQTKFDVPANFLPEQNTRAQVYAFVESELTAILAELPKENSDATYGRFTWYVAQATLAKLYMNAEVYTGTAQWTKALAATNEIVNSRLWGLEGDYKSNFVTNNAGSKEFILAVPFDKVFAQGFNLAQMTLHYGSQATFQLDASPWNGYCSLEEFYNSYDNADRRKGYNFIVGPQFAADGVTRIVDASAEASDPDGQPLNFTAKINEHQPNALRQAGARIGKYEFVKKATPNLSNDMPIFRYADFLLMKLELHIRLNQDVQAAKDLANGIRTRAGLAAFPVAFSLDDLLAERGREMFYEGVRRQDLIRFGKYQASVGFTPASVKGKELWPIPTSQRNANTKLAQNPTY
jgi:starch-binding outer membrane protein, SusD/RagB family